MQTQTTTHERTTGHAQPTDAVRATEPANGREVDPAKLEAFIAKIVNELGATSGAVLVRIGDQLGLYKAMADGEPVTPAELARRTGTHERYLREWLANQ